MGRPDRVLVVALHGARGLEQPLFAHECLHSTYGRAVTHARAVKTRMDTTTFSTSKRVATNTEVVDELPIYFRFRKVQFLF